MNRKVNQFNRVIYICYCINCLKLVYKLSKIYINNFFESVMINDRVSILKFVPKVSFLK